MLKKIILLSMTFGYLSTALTVNAEEMDYIAVPTAVQIADLEDDDNDGVINARDLCPETPAKAEVDNDGCEAYVETEETYQLHILFANDSDKVDNVFHRQIEGLAAFLKQYPTTSIEIQGYASKIGRAAHNLDLSIRRANKVRDALIGFDIEESRVKIVGYGDTILSSLGTDEVSHARNRRVTASVVGHKGNVKDEWTIFTTIPKVDK